MKIHFERGGGFAGTHITAIIDSKELTQDEGQELGELVNSSNFFNLPPLITSKKRGADRFNYKLTVESEDKRHTIVIDEGAVTPELRTLLQWLTAKAKEKST
ncbi:MAG: protealysin inhibitor emfourin [Thermodesulfobacteriota bacterium]